MKWGVVVAVQESVRSDMVFQHYLLGCYETKKEAQEVADFHNSLFPDQFAEVKKGGRS